MTTVGGHSAKEYQCVKIKKALGHPNLGSNPGRWTNASPPRHHEFAAVTQEINVPFSIATGHPQL